jgi:probable HAF family extracellular repeat protein
VLTRKQALLIVGMLVLSALCLAERPITGDLAAPSYRIVELPPLPGDKECVSSAVNEHGVVAGTSGDHATYWKDEKPFPLADFGRGSIAYGINDLGQVVGEARTPNGEWHAVLWSSGKIQDLGTLGGNYSAAMSINNKGVIVGNSEIHPLNHTARAFIWKARHMAPLKTPSSGDSSQANKINNNGEIVGYACLPGGSPCRAVLWKSADAYSFISDDEADIAQVINDRNEIVGTSDHSASDLASPPFFWSKGRLRLLKTPPSHRHLVPFAINNLGMIVGKSMDGRVPESTAFLYWKERLYDLNTIIGDKKVLVVTGAVGVNSHGFIAGNAVRDKKLLAVMLIPVK